MDWSVLLLSDTETEISFWRNFHHCVPWKLSKLQHPVQQMMKIHQNDIFAPEETFPISIKGITVYLLSSARRRRCRYLMSLPFKLATLASMEVFTSGYTTSTSALSRTSNGSMTLRSFGRRRERRTSLNGCKRSTNNRRKPVRIDTDYKYGAVILYSRIFAWWSQTRADSRFAPSQLEW